MISWITEYLGTSSWSQSRQVSDIRLVDVRDIVDKAGNNPIVIRAKIDESLQWLQRGERVVVCCDYGISRSNAVAAGILAEREKLSFDEAVRRVMNATGQMSIKLEVLSSVRNALLGDSSTVSRSKTRRILISGASGFIGSSLLGVLGQRYDVVGPSRTQIDLMHGTINLDTVVKERGINSLLHLANPRVYTTNESIGLMLTMLKNVLDVCTENDLWLLFLSSWEVYSGYNALELRADETLAPCPRGAYGQAKFLSEILINHYQQHHGLRCTVLRSSPIYGLGSDRPKFIWNFLQKALAHTTIVTHKYRNGFPALDLLHIDDLCSAILAAIDHDASGTFNLGTGKCTSTKDIAQMIIQQVGSRSTVSHLDIDDYVGNIVMDHQHASTLLGWIPRIPLRQGLQSLISIHRLKGDTANA